MTEPANLQDAGHLADHDYEIGSPHLTHPQLRGMALGAIREIVTERMSATGGCRVLELGAGHGAFTDHALAMGAHVTVTEMSRASADLLAARYERNPNAEVVFDETGEAEQIAGREFDVVMCMSVLHHIVDYLAAISSWMPHLAEGGTFLSFQDPLHNDRRSRTSIAADRGAYYAWRVLRGDLVEGAKSFLRRRSGNWDENNYRDMVEYHTIRQGVDEAAIVELLRPQFESVELITYWSTNSRALQLLGEKAGIKTTFGVRATGHRA